jgi:hypothetical protein
VLTASYTSNLLTPAEGAGSRRPVVGAGRTLVVCRGEASGYGAAVPFAVMQVTLTAVYGRSGISG